MDAVESFLKGIRLVVPTRAIHTGQDIVQEEIAIVHEGTRATPKLRAEGSDPNPHSIAGAAAHDKTVLLLPASRDTTCTASLAAMALAVVNPPAASPIS